MVVEVVVVMVVMVAAMLTLFPGVLLSVFLLFSMLCRHCSCSRYGEKSHLDVRQAPIISSRV